ncbi:hypothetical protein [Erythrobacter sp. YT30]|uniref:hypothetical protein n=1 Tax=Erythrobacter sp. YT30 TaxID=1735012 RepID=UPI000A75C700|nr:hypothetical protein [Erythrobacter sp. YT30]
MRALIIAGLAAVTLGVGACSSEKSGTFTDGDGNTGEYTVDSESGETAVTVETGEGTATMRSGTDVPVDLPGGFTIYPGAKVASNTIVSHGEGEGSMVILETDATPAELAEFYGAQAKDAGVEIQMDMTTGDTKMLAGETAEGLVFSLNATRQGDLTTAQVMVGDQMGR